MQDRREEKQVVCMQRCIKHLYNKTRHRGDRQESVPSYPAAVQRDRWQQGAELWMRGSPWFGKESTLPYFDDEVPVLYLADGTGYIPVVALCRMLSLSPETHIPRWRRLFLWVHARKLPLRTEARGTRMVWCLHLGALLFWCSSFNWSLVSPERRVQLRQATDAGLKHLEQAYQEMLTRYRLMRHLLFRFLTNYADA